MPEKRENRTYLYAFGPLAYKKKPLNAERPVTNNFKR